MDAAARSQAALQAAVDGDLRLLKQVAKEVDLRAAKDAGGRTALHAAAGRGRLDVCRFLVEESGLDVNSRCANGETAVLVAATEGHLPVLRYLLDRGGICTIRRREGHCDNVRLLLSKGVPLEPLANRWTPLHFAISKNQDKTLSILLDHGADAGADVNLTTPYGRTALMETVNNCLPDINLFKLQVEADPNNPGEALDDSLASVIKFLLEAGADPNIPNEHGKIPIMIAAAWGQRALVEILFSWTKPIPSLPDWNVDAIMRTLKMKTREAVSVELKECMADYKSKGKKAFRNEDYLAASFFYGLAMGIDPHDATFLANRSLCYLRMGEGALALYDAQQCRMMRPRWAKAWYRQGTALSMLKNYKAAAHAFEEALKLDTESDEIKNALREAVEAMRSSGEQRR
ncbi:hypothetical protein ACP70R_002878 [Stipagrostis hirtigluma subsp. patula]